MVEPALYSREEIQRLTTLSKWTIDRMVNRGEFPKPLELGARRVAWHREAVDRWIEDKISASTTKAA